MKQPEFLKQLKFELERFKVRNVDDVLRDYQEHFTHGLSSGKSEEDICERLGSPENIARAHETEALIHEVRSPEKPFRWSIAFTVIGRLLILAPFNFIVLFIPGVVLLSLIISGWAVSVALMGSAIGVMAFTGLTSIFTTSFWAGIAGISSGLGIFGMGILTGLILFLISKYVLLGLINYLQWNLKFALEPAGLSQN